MANQNSALYNPGSSSWLARARGAAAYPLPTLVDIGPAAAASTHTTAPINHTRPSPRKHSSDSTSEVANIWLLLTTHSSTSKGWKAVGWPVVDGLPT